jgi:two-component system sensor histidine kinase/response regulator
LCEIGINYGPKLSHEYLETVKSSADALLTVINAVLDFSKIEAGKTSLEPIDFSLTELLESTLRTLALHAEKKNLELLLRIDPEVPDFVCGDEGRLRQVITNLIGNAIKFTSQGEVGLKVQVEQAEEQGVTLHFTVWDTGIGIPKDKQGLVFEAFLEVKPLII